ncbi:MAG: transcriptional repressor [Gammaproteobacteria bacterium]|nr:transcriptional repressor [Gammaproteobacteria bacterium]RZO22377.1 MAG: transcriptional repressor [Candidatus Thioglobus sp.]
MKSKKDEIGSLAVTFREHDHAKCASLLLDAARDLCAERGLRLTPVREKVLKLLLKSHAPLGAYDILAELSTSGFRAQPPVAYRALDFLVENGLAHRIEKINAFVACSQPHAKHSPIFMICNDCEQVAETSIKSQGSSLDRTARAIGFDIRHTVVEVEGLCAACRERAPL